MNYFSLKTLLTVIQQNNFERAAVELHMTQSAVSQRIKLLEQHYGEPLLIRSHPYRATDLGETLLAHYKKVALMEASLEQDLRENPAPANFAIALNRDSLETWFQHVLPVIPRSNISIDIFSDDQEKTLNYLKQGMVIGAVSTHKKPLPGCDSHFLGVMNYLLVASPQFIDTYFFSVSEETLLNAPAILFDNKDQLHPRYLKHFFNLEKMPNYHFVPSIKGFRLAALHGLGYGLIPEIDIKKELAEKKLLNVCQDKIWQMPLYWHHFRMENKALQQFNALLIKTAKQLLPAL